MSLGSDVGGKTGIVEHQISVPTSVPPEFATYMLATSDAFVIWPHASYRASPTRLRLATRSQAWFLMPGLGCLRVLSTF